METTKQSVLNRVHPASELTKRELLSAILYAGLLAQTFDVNSDKAVRLADQLLESLEKKSNNQ